VSPDSGGADDRGTGPILAALNLHKTYGGVKAVEGVSVELFPGRVSALLGDNGAGKSTLLKILSGLIQPDYGELTFQGEPTKLRSVRQAQQLGIEAVYQDLALAESLDLTQNIFAGRELHTWGFVRRMAMERSAAELLGHLGVHVADVADPVRALSGGQRQGTAIARAVGWGSKVLLLDEPTAALGLRERAHVLKTIEALRTRRLAILLISHNLADVFELADDILILRRGRLIRRAAVDEIDENEVLALMSGVAVGARGGDAESTPTDVR
jgi:ABC-type sugar transport system ATPase subunit